MKLLDEKGLTTVWAAIKNTFTSKSDADEKYAEKSKALGSINFIYNKYGLNMITHNIDGGYSYTNITPATSMLAGVMTGADKSKLDGIASGANNYTLPAASETTLGGIKVSGNVDGNCWPICVDENGLAQTNIPGLLKDNNRLYSVMVSNEADSTYYNTNGISTENRASKRRAYISLPLKSGTFALLSDIPDVSNLCKFNFINSISECKSDRINFLFRYPDILIDLSPFDAYPDGTILIISVTNNAVTVRHNSGRWFYEGVEVSAGQTADIYKTDLKLMTKYGGKVHYYSL